MKSVFSRATDTTTIVDEVARGFDGLSPVAITLFVPHTADGAAITAALKRRFPSAEVIGCTHAGAFTERDTLTSGISAMALTSTHVRRAAGALATFAGGVREGVGGAIDRMGRALDLDLRQADPKRYAGVALVEGLRMKEEATNDALGDCTPQLAFVGGSAGDNLAFKETRVFYNGEQSNDGAALLVLDCARPFTVIKTCSFEPTGRRFVVTRADVANRTLYELDGQPALEVYAEACGTPRAQLDSAFLTHPVGLMIEGQPWIRSPQRALDDGGLKFYCRIDEGMQIELMRSTDLIRDMHEAIGSATKTFAAPAAGGIVFNCILRRLELDAKDQHKAFVNNLAGMNVAGFHTYGESYLGHINQTLTALLWK